jgi:hypothetical protein
VHFTCAAHSCSDLSWLELFVLSFLCRFALLVSSRISRSILFSLCACAVFPHHFSPAAGARISLLVLPGSGCCFGFSLPLLNQWLGPVLPFSFFLVVRQGRTSWIRRLAPDSLFPCLISIFYRPWRLGEHTIDQSQNPRLYLSCACWSRLEYLLH